jgi:hypothetical protein
MAEPISGQRLASPPLPNRARQFREGYKGAIASSLLFAGLVFLSFGVQSQQALSCGLFMALGIAVLMPGALNRTIMAAALACALFVNWGLAWAFNPYEVNLFYAIGEWKILAIFLVPNVVHALLTFSGFKYRIDDPTDAIVTFFKIYIVLLSLITVVTTLMGMSRSSGIFGHSINVSYGIAYLVAFLRNNLSRNWKISAAVPLILLGSGTGVAIYLLALFGIDKRKIGRSIILGSLCIILALVYSTLFRGKDIEGSWWDLDRAQILRYYFHLIGQNFTYSNYLFGYGPGHEFLSGLYTNLGIINGYFLKLLATKGVFSFGTHNEFLRLYLNFGIMALAIIYILYLYLPVEIFIIMLIACFTNTTLYHGNNIWILSIIICAYMWKRHQRTGGRPSLFPRNL